MSIKQLNEDTIVNELKDSSLFFKREKDERAATAEMDRVRPPVRGFPDPHDPEPHLASSSHVPSPQDPVQTPTSPINETADSPFATPPAAASSLVESNQSIPGAAHREPESSFENKQLSRKAEGAPNTTGVRPSESPAARTPVRIKRTITRYAFEFFQDQLTTLKDYSLEEQLRGEKGSMSQMVREALDAYISKRKRTED